MADDFVDLPFRAEYAKSSRAACKACKEKIEKETLRLAVLVQSAMFDGKQPNWYHFHCFFIKQRPKSVAEFSHFQSLRWDDQEKIRKQVESLPTSSSSSAKATKRKPASSKDIAFQIEYSKSSRARCRGCEQTIIKGDIRISKKDYESDEGRQYGGIDLWHHLECFIKLREDLGFLDSGSVLPGYKTLKTEDQHQINNSLPVVKSVKKEATKLDSDVEVATKKPKMSDELMKKQNKDMFYYRDHLKKLHRNDLIKLFRYNDQEVPEGIEKSLDRLCDIMCFGALERCKKCINGQLVFRSGCGYFCLGSTDEWTKCEAVDDEPARKKFKVPKELKESHDFLKEYKSKISKRLFEKITPSSTDETDAKTEERQGPKIKRILPCNGMEFALGGKLSRNKEDFKLDVQRLGGTLTNKVNEMTTVVISSKEIVKKNGAATKLAKEMNIQIVPENFLEECKNKKEDEVVALINDMNLVSWGSDPTKRISVNPLPTSKSTGKSFSKRFKSSGPSKITLKVKDGNAVDPEADVDEDTHVYKDPESNVYNASLSLTDLQTGKNSYYKMQIIESRSKRYWLFRSWGRIGTTIGGTRTESMSRESAIDQFKHLFHERTANRWEDRKNFVKKNGKMAMIDICYEDNIPQNDESKIKSNLPEPIQDLMKLIFDINLMKEVMKDMELDLEKMPLGKLSKKQIHEAYYVLTTLQDIINKSKEKIDKQILIKYTNQFFTLIPHDYGMDTPPLLNSLELIKKKTELLDSLMEIELAYSMLKSSDEQGDTNSIDSHYLKLKADINVLNKDCSEYDMIQKYLKNTHASTHKYYDLEIIEIFKLDRQGEDDRFKPFKSLHNRQLLWHGSRSTNFVGIISQGLRIAPPEAPVTGYMFGKGIYFADMVSKSANYCMTTLTNTNGLLLLCEVALGNMEELYQAKNIVKPPAGKHSVKGIGKTAPDPASNVVLTDGVVVPLGEGVSTNIKKTSLLYNEYIVYDVAQVKVRYLIRTNFKYT